MHILVVDDDNRIRDLLKEYLTEKDYIVSTSDNAENAKIKITQFKFDLIILDVMMPGQDGYVLTKEIRKNMKVPIILLTAKGEVENRIKGGVSIIGHKPSTAQDLNAGKPLEIDPIIGSIIEIANKLDLNVPKLKEINEKLKSKAEDLGLYTRSELTDKLTN